MPTPENKLYNIRVKQETINWNYANNNHAARQKRQEELNQKFKNNLFVIFNKIVKFGGTICMDRHTLDNEWRIFSPNIRVLMPVKFIEELRADPNIESITE
jgi:hypothetical protein